MIKVIKKEIRDYISFSRNRFEDYIEYDNQIYHYACDPKGMKFTPYCLEKHINNKKIELSEAGMHGYLIVYTYLDAYKNTHFSGETYILIASHFFKIPHALKEIALGLKEVLED